MAQLSVVADLDFTLTVDDPRRREVSGHLRGSGSHLEMHVDDPTVFAGREDAGFVRGLSDALANHGLSVTVVAPQGPLLTLGAARTGWLQRWITGSRHIRYAGTVSLLSVLRARNAVSVLPGARTTPPATPLPLAPTFLRRPRTVTTTHDPERGGNPRLVAAPRDDPWPGDEQPRFPLHRDVTTIGSAADCDIVLPGLEPHHVEVRHDDQDEFVVVRLADPGSLRVNGEPVAARILRTGSRLTLGATTLTYFREEYADHGRPYGGRVGGEVGHQRPQPPRPASPHTHRKEAWPTP